MAYKFVLKLIFERETNLKARQTASSPEPEARPQAMGRLASLY